ncbi:VOC family protein [Nitrincola sp. MINF-07-Sa-05]|uniref:VOC family protein n=1 Tax=Nitrincola salilacus TaxID=3400273 RepID=UPI0039183040
MFRIAAIDHIVLRTAHLDRMLAFYVDVLGCVVERELPPEKGLIQLRAGNALIDLVTTDSEMGRKGGEAPAETGRNLDHFCLLLEPLSEQEILDYLHNKGIEGGEFIERYGSEGMGRSVYIEDPDGNTVELRARQDASALSWV